MTKDLDSKPEFNAKDALAFLSNRNNTDRQKIYKYNGKQVIVSHKWVATGPRAAAPLVFIYMAGRNKKDELYEDHVAMVNDFLSAPKEQGEKMLTEQFEILNKSLATVGV